MQGLKPGLITFPKEFWCAEAYLGWMASPWDPPSGRKLGPGEKRLLAPKMPVRNQYLSHVCIGDSKNLDQWTQFRQKSATSLG